MAKLIILRGLPAPGKSTWARSWCEDPANTWPHCVISLDDIRLMIAGSAQVRNRCNPSTASDSMTWWLAWDGT